MSSDHEQLEVREFISRSSEKAILRMLKPSTLPNAMPGDRRGREW